MYNHKMEICECSIADCSVDSPILTTNYTNSFCSTPFFFNSNVPQLVRVTFSSNTMYYIALFSSISVPQQLTILTEAKSSPSLRSKPRSDL
jgi:hypothetical protein